MPKEIKVLKKTTDPDTIPRRKETDPQLKVVQGPPSTNWLASYPPGTVFHSRLKLPPYGIPWLCTQYHINVQYNKTTAITDVLADQYMIVDSYMFSQDNVLVEIVQYGKGST